MTISICIHFDLFFSILSVSKEHEVFASGMLPDQSFYFCLLRGVLRTHVRLVLVAC